MVQYNDLLPQRENDPLIATSETAWALSLCRASLLVSPSPDAPGAADK